MRNLVRLLALFAPDLPWLLLGALLAAASLVLNIAVFAGIGLLAGGGLIISLRLLAGARVVARYAERLGTHSAMFRILARLRLWLFGRLVPLAPLQLGMSRSGDTLSRLTGDIDALDGLYLRILLPLLLILVAGSAGLYGLALVLPMAVWVVLALLAVLVIALALLARSSLQPQALVLSQQAELRTHIIDGVEGLDELLASGAGHQQASVIARSSSGLVRQQLAVQRAQSRATLATQLVQGLVLLAFIACGWPLLEQHNLAPGLMVVIVLVWLAGSELLASLGTAFLAAPRLNAAAGRIFALADTVPAVTEPAQPLAVPHSGAISFEHVGLSYGREAPALHYICLTLPPGERVAIMGPSGAGKSSLGLLLLRFALPTSGVVRVGGVDLARLDGDAWRTHIGYLGQHTRLVAGTLRDNLLLAKPDASDADLQEALTAVDLGAWLANLPDGLASWVGEDGLQLSGGQARRVALAMVLLRDAPIWLLDEPTEGLDADTAQAVLATINRLTQSRSLILITHDDTILQPLGLKRLVLLENGRISADTPL